MESVTELSLESVTELSMRRRPRLRVAVSGGFDPIHRGHLRYIEEAAKLGNWLIVILNSVEFLEAKKGYFFYPDEERIAILESNFWVDEVVLWRPQITSLGSKTTTDLSVCGALEQIKPDVFAKGGDRRPDGDPIPEEETCKRLGIRVEYGVGGNEKMNSSSWLIETAYGRYRERK